MSTLNVWTQMYTVVCYMIYHKILKYNIIIKKFINNN